MTSTPNAAAAAAAAAPSASPGTLAPDASPAFRLAMYVILLVLVGGGAVAATMVINAERIRGNDDPYYYGPRVLTQPAAPVVNSSATWFPGYPMAGNPLADLPMGAELKTGRLNAGGTGYDVTFVLTNRGTQPMTAASVQMLYDVTSPVAIGLQVIWPVELTTPLAAGETRELTLTIAPIAVAVFQTVVPESCTWVGADDAATDWRLDQAISEAEVSNWPANEAGADPLLVCWLGNLPTIRPGTVLPILRVYNLDPVRSCTSFELQVRGGNATGTTTSVRMIGPFTLSTALPPRHAMTVVDPAVWPAMAATDLLDPSTRNPAFR
ncbi:MAG: hypothetical protein AB7K09_15815 [Planctomycetota bacterium]